jgi:hypothetical protein
MSLLILFLLLQMEYVTYVDEVKRYLWTAATNGRIVHRHVVCKYGEAMWKYIDRGKPSNSEKNLSRYHIVPKKNPTLSGPDTNSGHKLPCFVTASCSYDGLLNHNKR